MPVDITPGVSADDPMVKRLQELLELVLQDINSVLGSPAPQRALVTCRLNVTGQAMPSPVWYGWVESPRKPLPRNLIGTTHLSPVYQECFYHPDQIIARHYPKDAGWEKIPDPRFNPQAHNSFSHDANSGLNWRRFICIKAGQPPLTAGTVTVGFPTAPGDASAVETRLRDWAKGSNGRTALVDFLTNSFRLGGAAHP